MNKTIYFNVKIIKVGTNYGVLKLKDENISLVDLEGKTILP